MNKEITTTAVLAWIAAKCLLYTIILLLLITMIHVDSVELQMSCVAAIIANTVIFPRIASLIIDKIILDAVTRTQQKANNQDWEIYNGDH